MPDEPRTTDDALDEGALLDAYLDDETDDVTSARLDRRLAADPALAARLDTLANTRARLQRLDEVSAPPQARQRLDAALREARADTTTEAPPAAAPTRPRRRWRVIAPTAAAAAIVVLAALGLTGVLGPVGMSEEALIATGSDDAGGEAAEEAEAGQLDAAAGADGAQGEREAAGAAPAITAPAVVTGDAEISARARRLRADPPASLAAREQRLRDAAGLSSTRLCVDELEAVTVDLIDDGGRVALAVLVDPADQIVLLDPRTCATIRTVPAAG